jgi:ribonuclease HI
MPRRTPTPRGKSLFGDAAAEPKPAAAAYRANIDGGSRGNPGPAAYGVVIRDGSGELVAKLKKYIGRMSNNVAEYYGLIAALDYAQSHKIRALRIESDSELLVKQMRGQYKVKSADLQPLFERAKKMAQGFDSFRIDHVYRAEPGSGCPCERSAGCRRGHCPRRVWDKEERSVRCETRVARRQAGASPHPRAFSRRSSLSSGRRRIAGRHGGRRFHPPSPKGLNRRRPPFISKRTNGRECRAGRG